MILVHPSASPFFATRANFCHPAVVCAPSKVRSCAAVKAAQSAKADRDSGKSHTFVRRIGKATVTEEEDRYSVSLDLPGVKVDDVRINQQGGNLQVAAQRKAGDDTVVSAFAQTLSFDDTTTDMNAIKADLEDGVLLVTVPKKEKDEPVQIPVVAADPSPPADGEESEGEKSQPQFVYMSLDMPGVKLADVKISYHPNKLLLVEGKRSSPHTHHIRHAFDGRAMDPDLSEAFLVDGVLTIKAALRKDTAPSKRAIEINREQPTKPISAEEEVVSVETVAEEDEERDVAKESESATAADQDKEWHHVLEESD